MAMTSDDELFSLFENCEINDAAIEKIVIASLKIKAKIVSCDEKESGLRKILNFGHSFGHGIEAELMGELYHGECVALGMIPMTKKELRPRLANVLQKLNLQIKVDINTDKALSHVINDKKAEGEFISAIFVDEIGKYRITRMKIAEFCDYIKENL